MFRKQRALYGSKRASFFKEPKKSSRFFSTKKRSQHVRFRRRYASSVAQRVSGGLGRLALWTGIAAVLVWGGRTSWNFWETSYWLRVANVYYEGDIPKDLLPFLSLQAGQHLFYLKPLKMEKEALEKFPELKNLTINRTFHGNVIVHGEYRKEVGLTNRAGRKMGVDSQGKLFPIRDENHARMRRPFLASTDNQLVSLAAVLDSLQKENPDFYSLIKQIETDIIRDSTVELRNGVIILWGEMSADNLMRRCSNLARLMEEFTPKQVPATLRFVADERIVLDSNWVRSSQNKKAEGGNHVKT